MTVVVGYVSTPEGRAALDHAIQECRLRSTSLLVVESRGEGEAVDDHLGRAVERARAEGVDVELRKPTHQREPSEDIIEAAEASAADLIVIGLRRRTPVGKLILGSNAQRILLDSSCPVLAVKAPQA